MSARTATAKSAARAPAASTRPFAAEHLGPDAPRARSPEAIQRGLGAGSSLPGDVRGRMERGFGASFGEVRVHTDERAGRLALGLDAHAFAVGQQIAFAPGEFAPGTLRGEVMLAHELAHTLQQRGSRSAESRAETGRGSAALEREADQAAVAVGAHLAGLTAASDRARIPAVASGGLRLQRCDTSSPAAMGPQPTLSSARASGTTLPTRPLEEMDVSTLADMSASDRRTWYASKLNPYSGQLRESAQTHAVPVQLLALVILNELADINFMDLAQSDLAVTAGSLGISQIQIDTVMRDNLFPDLTAAEGTAAYDAFVRTQRGLSRRLAAEVMRSPDKERRSAINHRLQVPQFAIDAAAREIRILIDRMIANRGASWQTRQGFTHAGLAPGASPQSIYANVNGADQREKEMNLGTMIAGAYNSPAIISAVVSSQAVFPNANIHGDNSRMISGDLFDFGLFRP